MVPGGQAAEFAALPDDVVVAILGCLSLQERCGSAGWCMATGRA